MSSEITMLCCVVGFVWFLVACTTKPVSRILRASAKFAMTALPILFLLWFFGSMILGFGVLSTSEPWLSIGEVAMGNLLALSGIIGGIALGHFVVYAALKPDKDCCYDRPHIIVSVLGTAFVALTALVSVGLVWSAGKFLHQSYAICVADRSIEEVTVVAIEPMRVCVDRGTYVHGHLISMKEYPGQPTFFENFEPEKTARVPGGKFNVMVFKLNGKPVRFDQRRAYYTIHSE